MPRNSSWTEEAWEEFLKKYWDIRSEGEDSIEYTKKELEPILSKYTKSGQGEIRIFHSSSPKVKAVQKRGVTILAVSRSVWKIIKNTQAVDFKEPSLEGEFQPKKPLTEGMLAGIQFTLDSKSNPGETTLLAIANHIGIISDFYGLENGGVLFTGGRQKANVHLILSSSTIDISKAQIEIDGGFEWSKDVVIVEMKSSFKQKEFNVRQALIPMLKWQKLLAGKKVHSMVLLAETNSKGIEYWAFDLVRVSEKSGIEMRIQKSKKYEVSVERN